MAARMSSLSGRNEPAHYMLKIESFSLLSQEGTKNFESPVFEASGYKWSVFCYRPLDGTKFNFFRHIF